MTPEAKALVLLATLAVFTLVSKKKKLLDRDGLLIANIVGITIYLLGGLDSFFLIVFFFVASEIATKIGREKERHGTRTTGNILGNSVAAILALYFYSQFGYYGAVSAALADTLSSEIGLLSKEKPRLITSWKKVRHGTDGGITPLGCGAAVLGASMVGLIHLFQYNNIVFFAVLIASGFLGSLADSFFGATLELKKKLNNAEVNFLGSGSGALISILLKTVFMR